MNTKIVRKIEISILIVILSIIVGPYTYIYGCTKAAHYRMDALSEIGICPAFVKTPLAEIEENFITKMKSDGSAESIENALRELDISYGYDQVLKRYSGIIRHPESNFHAITVKVYLNDKQKYKSIELRDSYTAL